MPNTKTLKPSFRPIEHNTSLESNVCKTLKLSSCACDHKIEQRLEFIYYETTRLTPEQIASSGVR